MLLLKIFILYIAQATSVDVIFDYSSTKFFVLDRLFRSCPNYGNLTFKMSLDRFHDGLFDFSIVNEVDIKQPILFVEFIKCVSKDAPDTCSVMSKMRTTMMCRMLTSENDIWSDMTKSLKPRFVCPIKKNTYKATNCSVDMSKFKFFPLSTNFYLKFRVTILDKDTKKIVTCFFGEGQLKYKKQTG